MSSAFSHSRLSLLDDCPRRYRFRYVDKLAEAFQTAEAFMGTMVHEALQWLYLEREARREPGEDEVVAKYRETWASRLGPSVRVVQDGAGGASEQIEALARFRADGEELLRRHRRGPFASDRMSTLAVEPKVTLRLRTPDGEAAYVGYVDRLARDEGGRMHVIDYKTSKRMPESFEAAGLQVRGYGLAILEEHGGLEVGLRYEYLRHGRALEETMPREKGGAVAAAISARIARALQAERDGDFPARPSALCRWCGYRDACEDSPFHAPQAPRAATVVVVAASSETCPLCRSGLRYRASTRSVLVACERYPDCLHAREAEDGDAERFPPATGPARRAAS